LVGSPFDLYRYNAEALARRSGVKWARDGPGVLAAWVADMDYPLAPAVTAALRGLVDLDDLGYPPPSLELAVRDAFVRRYRDRYGCDFNVADVIVTTEVVQSIYLALLTLTDAGDAVVFFTPAYPPCFAALAETGREALPCELRATPGGYRIDFDQLRALASRARCLLLCNPHNPTGRAFSRGELLQIAEIAQAYDLLIISDEIHADLTLPGAVHTPVAGLGPEVAARTVTLFSASKAFNLAAVRCAVAAFGSSSLHARFDAIPPSARGSSSVLGMSATLAAWTSGEAWLDAVLSELSSNRDSLTAWCERAAGVGVHPPEATFLAWIDFRATAATRDPAAWFRTYANVALAPGPDYGESGAGFARLNFATPRPVLDEILQAMTSALVRD
jgi:cystathionine beta-lyase